MSDADSNEAIVRELIEAWNRGDVQGMSGLWHPDMVHHGRTGPIKAKTTAQEMTRFIQAFPDLKMKLEHVSGCDDIVYTRIRMVATHQAEFVGLPATGNSIECSLIGQLRFMEGKVIEHWGVADGILLLVQIGAIDPRYLEATA